MNALIIDIRDTCLRAVLSSNGTLDYCRTFEFELLAPVTPATADVDESEDFSSLAPVVPAEADFE